MIDLVQRTDIPASVGPISWSLPKEWYGIYVKNHVKVNGRAHQLYPFRIMMCESAGPWSLTVILIL